MLVSGLTVMVAMAGMYLGGASTFTSFATGTIIVVAVAVVGSLTVLPALLACFSRAHPEVSIRLSHDAAPALARAAADAQLDVAFIDGPTDPARVTRIAIGHAELLDTRGAVDHWKANGLDLAPLFETPELPAGGSRHRVVAQDHALDKALDAAARDADAASASEPVVLLSPACASFDQYRNFEVRGDAFRALVRALPGLTEQVEAATTRARDWPGAGL